MIYAIYITIFFGLALFCAGLNAGMEDSRGHFDGLLALLGLGFISGLIATIGLAVIS